MVKALPDAIVGGPLDVRLDREVVAAILDGSVLEVKRLLTPLPYGISRARCSRIVSYTESIAMGMDVRTGRLAADSYLPSNGRLARFSPPKTASVATFLDPVYESTRTVARSVVADQPDAIDRVAANLSRSEMSRRLDPHRGDQIALARALTAPSERRIAPPKPPAVSVTRAKSPTLSNMLMRSPTELWPHWNNADPSPRKSIRDEASASQLEQWLQNLPMFKPRQMKRLLGVRPLQPAEAVARFLRCEMTLWEAKRAYYDSHMLYLRQWLALKLQSLYKQRLARRELDFRRRGRQVLAHWAFDLQKRVFDAWAGELRQLHRTRETGQMFFKRLINARVARAFSTWRERRETAAAQLVQMRLIRQQWCHGKMGMAFRRWVEQHEEICHAKVTLFRAAKSIMMIPQRRAMNKLIERCGRRSKMQLSMHEKLGKSLGYWRNQGLARCFRYWEARARKYWRDKAMRQERSAHAKELMAIPLETVGHSSGLWRMVELSPKRLLQRPAPALCCEKHPGRLAALKQRRLGVQPFECPMDWIAEVVPVKRQRCTFNRKHFRYVWRVRFSTLGRARLSTPAMTFSSAEEEAAKCWVEKLVRAKQVAEREARTRSAAVGPWAKIKDPRMGVDGSVRTTGTIDDSDSDDSSIDDSPPAALKTMPPQYRPPELIRTNSQTSRGVVLSDGSYVREPGEPMGQQSRLASWKASRATRANKPPPAKKGGWRSVQREEVLNVHVINGRNPLGLAIKDNVVLSVKPEGPCEKLLFEGDRIIAVDGQPLGKRSVHKVIRKAPAHTLRLIRETLTAEAKKKWVPPAALGRMGGGSDSREEISEEEDDDVELAI